MSIVARALAFWLFILAPSARAETALSVVVTVKPVHSLAAAIMAGVGEPRLLVQGSASPHTFTLRPSAARAIETADIFIRVSEATEPFTRHIVESLPKQVSSLTLADEKFGVKLLEQRSGGAFDAHRHVPSSEHEKSEDASDGAKDGHIWLDPDNAKAIVTAVSQALSARDPEHAQKFGDNAALLKARIDAMAAEIASSLKPAQGKPFIAFHDAYQYFEAHFGLNAIGSITVTPDQQTSAKRLSEIRQKIKETGAACVFAEPGFQPNLVSAVSEGTQARSATLDPEGLMLSPGPELYFDLMKTLSAGFRSCLVPSG